MVEANLSAGRVVDALGRNAAAVRAWTRAFEFSRDAPVLVRLKGRLDDALAARRQGYAAVLQHGRAGMDDFARHRAALASTELRTLASGHGAELGGLGLASLVRTSSPARVLDWMERTASGAALSTAALRWVLNGQVLVEYDVLEGSVLAAALEPRRTRIVPLGPVDLMRFEVDALLFALRRLPAAALG